MSVATLLNSEGVELLESEQQLLSKICSPAAAAAAAAVGGGGSTRTRKVLAELRGLVLGMPGTNCAQRN